MRSVPFLLAAVLACGAAAAAPPEPPPGADSPVRQVGEGLYRVGRARVNVPERSVRCGGRVNMDEGGPIELLACLPRGKTHESVFVLDVEPVHLQVALLLLGAREGRNPAYQYPEWDEDRARPPGELATIRVEWGDQICAPAEAFLYNVAEETPMVPATWAFLGSAMVRGRFGADLDGTLVTTYHDPLAILELNLPTVNDDIYYYVNEEVCPPVGTPVELVIRLPARPTGDDEPATEGES